MFGQPNVFGSSSSFPQTTQTPLFGQTTQGGSPGFGMTSTGNAPLFGQTAQTGTATFGQADAPKFGQVTQANVPAFGQTSAALGQSIQGNTPTFGQMSQGSSPLFGQTTQGTAPVFGQTFGQTTKSNAPTFGQATQRNISTFGTGTKESSASMTGASQQTLGSFGTMPVSNASFGQGRSSTESFMFKTTPGTSSSAFSSTTVSVFGQAGGSQVFGQSSQPFGSSSSMGEKTTASLLFGQTDAFKSSGSPPSLFSQRGNSSNGGDRSLTSGSSTGFSSGTRTVFAASRPQPSSIVFGSVRRTSTNNESDRLATDIIDESKSQTFGTNNSSLFGSKQTTSSLTLPHSHGVQAVNPFGGNKEFGAVTSQVFATTSVSGQGFGTSKTSRSSGSSGLLGARGAHSSSAGNLKVVAFHSPDTSSADHVPSTLDSTIDKTPSTQPTKGIFGMQTSHSGSVLERLGPTPEREGTIDKTPFTQPSTGLFGVQTSHSGSVLDRLGPTPEREGTSGGLFGKQEERQMQPLERGKKATASKAIGGEKEGKRSRGLFGQAIKNVAVENKKDLPKLNRPRRVALDAEADVEQVTDSVEKDTSVKEKFSVTKKSKGKDNTRKSSSRSVGRVTHRFSSVEEPSVIMCRGVPQSCNNKMTLRKHFGQFGQVNRVFPNQAKDTAVIHFEKHSDADNAKRNGRVIKQGFKPLTIFWSSFKTKAKGEGDSDNGHSSPEEGSSSRRHSSKTSPRSTRPTQLKSHSYSSAKRTGNKAVDDELTALQGTGDIRDEELVLLSRPSEQPASQVPSVKSGKGGFTARNSERPTSPGPRRVARSASPLPPRVTRSASPVPPSKDLSSSPTKSGKSSITMSDALASLKTTVAHNAAERRAVLEIRDKLVRQEREKRQKDNRAGTCQDMCPEKERYTREDQRRLSVYEMKTGTEGHVDHRTAVKEYSRSSADQEMPLPHELRSSAVLQTTMNYLLNNVMDCGGEGQWEDWYEYLWSRTRAIRKDITQQSLCELISVGLVEKCARFHIYCSHRLCEQSHMVFDVKLNNENLTKCLQSLKEMYHDLAVRGIFCPNESEFRGYMILMNLNEGTTLRDIQQLRPDVRASQPVEFALAMYKALNSQNYVRFFKLVNRASFLNACILHRYFGQVRVCALKVMIRVYNIAGKPASYFPLADLVRLLGFEEEAEAADFAEHYGLLAGQGQLLVDRLSFGLPDSAPPAKRAMRLVESKQMSTAGEVVNGGPLPPNVVPEPVSSFDDSGHFRLELLEMLINSSEGRSEDPGPAKIPLSLPTFTPPPQPAFTPSPQPTQIPNEPSPQVDKSPERIDLAVPNELVKDVTKDIFLEVIKDMCVSMGLAFVQARNHYMAQVEPLFHDVLDNIIPPVVSQVCEEVLDEAHRSQAELMARQRAEKAIQHRRVAEDITNDLLTEVLENQVNDISVEKISEVKNELKKESIVRCSCEIMEHLCADEVDHCIHQVACSFHQLEVKQRLEALEEKAHAVGVLRCSRFLKQWKNEYARRQRLKRNMMDFPAAPAMDTTAVALQHLVPESRGVLLEDDSIHLGENTYLTLMSQDQVAGQSAWLNRRLLSVSIQQRLHHLRAWAPLELAETLGPVLYKSHYSHAGLQDVYWKCLVVFPIAEEGSVGRDEADQLFVDWIKAKLTHGSLTGPEEQYGMSLLSQYSSRVNIPESEPDLQANVHSVVQCLEGQPTEDQVESIREKLVLQGCGILLLVLPICTTSSVSQYWALARARLRGVLALLPSEQCLPLVVVSCDVMVFRQASRALDLNHLVETQTIACFTLLDIEHDIEELEASQQLLKVLSKATEDYPTIPNLKSLTLMDFVEDGLAFEFYPRLQKEIQRHHHAQKLPVEPSYLVELYNAVLDHLASIARQPALTRLAWPVSEFRFVHAGLPDRYWNQPEHLSQVSDMIRELRLPPFHVSKPYSEAWEHAVGDLSSYVKRIIDQFQHSPVVLISRIQWLISQTEEKFHVLCEEKSGEEDCEPQYINMPWTHVIRECIDYSLTSLSNAYSQSSSEVTAHSLIYYIESLCPTFQEPVSWTDTTLGKHDIPNLNMCIDRSVKRKRDEKSKLGSPPKYLKSDITGLSMLQTPGKVDSCLDTSASQTRLSIGETQTSDSSRHDDGWISPSERSRMFVPRARLDLNRTEPEELETAHLMHAFSNHLASEKLCNSSTLDYYDEALEEGETWLNNYLSKRGLSNAAVENLLSPLPD